MKRWLVRCGEMEEIIDAETGAYAASKLFTMFDKDENPPSPGEFLSYIQVADGAEEYWMLSESAIKAAGRLVTQESSASC